MIELDPKTIVAIVPFNARRRLSDYVQWGVLSATDGEPWLPGDTFTLYRVGRTNAFRVEHHPGFAINRLRARFGATCMPLWLLLDAVRSGRLEQTGGNLRLTARSVRDDEDVVGVAA